VSLAWYLIYSKPKQEAIAALNLERQAYTIFLPYAIRQKRLRGIYQAIREPLFPRYLFIHLNDENDNWGPIRSTRGVLTLVRFGGQPARIPGAFIEELKTREARGEYQDNKRLPSFQAGEKVRIAEGVLSGYDAIFETQLSTDRVKILLEIANKYTQICLSIDQIVRV